MKEAEQFAAEDKKNREKIDVRNAADQMVYQSEKALTDLGDKVAAADKDELTQKINALKEALKGENLEDIKAKQEDLQKKFYEVSSKVYEAAKPADAPQDGAASQEPPKDDNVVDADYREVDDDNK